MSFRVPEQHRLDARGCAAIGADPTYGTDSSIGNYGMFLLPAIVPGRGIKVIASEGQGWDHVSVSISGAGRTARKRQRVPTWVEMCAVKDAFWEPEDVVMQLHPRASQYVNEHPGCLHLWRPNDGRSIPEPPSLLVGPTAGQERT